MAGPRMRFNPAMLRGPDPFAVDPLAAIPARQSDEELLLRGFLETGEVATPKLTGDEWSDEDWQIAALSGDPMGVREMYDKVSSQGSEEDFIKQLSGLDWSQPDVANRVAQMVGQNPRGFTKQTASFMDLFRDLGTKKQPDWSSVATLGSDALKMAREIYSQTGDMPAAVAAARDFAEGNKRGTGKGLPIKEAKALDQIVSEAQSPMIPAKDDKGNDDATYMKEKRDAFKASTGRDLDIKSADDWNKAHEIWAKGKSGAALDKVKEAVRAYQISGYAVPEEILRLIGDAPEAPVVAPEVVAPAVPEPAPPVVTAPAPSLRAPEGFSSYEASLKARAPQELEGSQLELLNKAGVQDILDYYMYSTPENSTNPKDVSDSNEAAVEYGKELMSKLGLDPKKRENWDTLDAVAKYAATHMGPHAYQPKFGGVKQVTSTAPTGGRGVIKSIKLKS